MLKRGPAKCINPDVRKWQFYEITKKYGYVPEKVDGPGKRDLMEIGYDRTGRKLYTFSSSVAQGGYLYAHKTSAGAIVDKEGLRNALSAISKKHELIDVTIKVYDTIFFLFF